MPDLVIKNATIVNEGRLSKASVVISGENIEAVIEGDSGSIEAPNCIDASSLILIPGVIDSQVHFRDPGLTHKGDLYTESRAALAGGITSFFDMPNTVPNTLSQDLLEAKYQLAATKSWANYSFYMGSSNDNASEALNSDPRRVCGIKIFLGASTGNMLVDNPATLERLFAESQVPIAVHCEDEPTIQQNIAIYKAKFGEDIDIKYHPEIRSREACYKSSLFAIELARKHNTRLHLLHLSSAEEMGLLLGGALPKQISSEVCVHHLYFSDADYAERGSRIKWNPSIKSKRDQEALWEALLDDRLDLIATDHAPHSIEEKSRSYFQCPSGGPLVQHSLLSMLEHYHAGRISLEKIVSKMCHAPADCFNIAKRGYIKAGYKADLTLLELNSPRWTVQPQQLLYRCAWSPFEGLSFGSLVLKTFVNGRLSFSLDRDAFLSGLSSDQVYKISDQSYAQRIVFDR